MVDATNIIGGKEKDALDAVQFLLTEGITALAFEKGAGNPGGAPENAGGVDGGGHGVEVLVKLGGIDQLGLVDGEKQAGGGADNPGALVAGEELEAGFAEFKFIACLGFPDMAGADTGIERRGDALHIVEGLRFVGGGNVDDAPTNLGVTIKKPGEDMGLDLVLAGLAREDDHKGKTQLIQDRCLDGKGDAALVGTEVDTAGRSPADGITADGLADAGGEEGLESAD